MRGLLAPEFLPEFVSNRVHHTIKSAMTTGRDSELVGAPPGSILRITLNLLCGTYAYTCSFILGTGRLHGEEAAGAVRAA